MGYEEGFEALNRGDYRRAVDLLGRAAASTDFASDLINHAYTLALYRAGERDRIAEVAFRVGMGMVEADPASALDYFQRAAQAGLSPVHSRLIAEIHERWAGEKRLARLHGPIARVGHVVSALGGDPTFTQYLRLLVHSLKLRGLDSIVFTTEANASWFMNPSARPVTSSETAASINGQVLVGTLEGDFLQRAESLAETIQNSGIQLIFYHTNLCDQIATRTAAMRPSAVQVSVNSGIEIDADLFDGAVHLSRNSFERTRRKSQVAAWIPPASDIEAKLQSEMFESRESLGIGNATTVSASFAGPGRNQGEFLKALIEIMRRFPSHFHLFAGAGDVRAIRGLLHSEGVLSRMRFLGQLADPLRLLGAIDVCLVPFPETTGFATLENMGAGKPVVALLHGRDSEFNTAAELIGEAELSPRTPGEYIQITDRLLRNPAERARLGDRLRERFRREFTPDRLGEGYVNFFEKLR